ncbi:MAG TPA: hypothetical protein VG317_18990, partial [Pseudonocardiaceae bacterium]|nr:hypothetical protein [Pseudonocardiaceae bacterium]
VAPLFYGLLINKAHPDRGMLFIGYIVGAAVMIVGGVIAALLGIAAEGRSLEDIAKPLSVVRKASEKVAGLAGGLKPPPPSEPGPAAGD